MKNKIIIIIVFGENKMASVFIIFDTRFPKNQRKVMYVEFERLLEQEKWFLPNVHENIC